MIIIKVQHFEGFVSFEIKINLKREVCQLLILTKTQTFSGMNRCISEIYNNFINTIIIMIKKCEKKVWEFFALTYSYDYHELFLSRYLKAKE